MKSLTKLLLLSSIIILAVSCKKDKDDPSPNPYPKKFVYHHEAVDFRVWANGMELIPAPFTPVHFTNMIFSVEIQSYTLFNDHQLNIGTNTDTIEYIIDNDTLKFSRYPLDTTIAGIIQGDDLISHAGAMATITNSSHYTTTSSSHFQLQDGLDDLGYTSVSEMQSGDTIAVANYNFYYRR